MTSKGKEAPSATDGGKRAITRMRLARRVADALLPQPEGVRLEAVSPTEVLGRGPDAADPPLADFILSLSDLKIRLLLLSGQPSEALQSTNSLELAEELLREHVDTLACALVADDQQLSTRLIETGESAQVIASQAGGAAAAAHIGPIRSVIEDYLHIIDPNWPATPSVLVESHLNYAQVAHQAAEEATEQRQQARGTVDERQLARRDLSDADAAFAASLSLRVAGGESVDLLSAIEETQGDEQ